MQTLETERLILRDWQPTDLDDFYTYAKIDGVGQMAGWPPHKDKETSKRILDSFIQQGDVYAIVLKATGQVIGSLGIHDRQPIAAYPETVQRDIGYVLSKNHWGKGIMPEAVKTAIHHAFTELGIDILWCAHFTSNTQSKSVILKTGFTFYQDSTHQTFLSQEPIPGKRYILTKEAYQPTHS